ncbi:enoyl-CoA hydratase-related protein [Streptomyces specialis]|uniref:enoyl-CoA hydratase-related protein n=1 Tax=Streptomyces specialis TaxID=498367 RepID=UPI00073F9E8B|nr:enoyl-CoA hydratase-related protein [Streptomyces specialis]
MTEPVLRTDRGVPGVVTATLARPARRNTIDPALIAALHGVLDAAESDPDGRLVVLRGSDGVFSAGMDFEAAAAGGVPDRATAARGAAEFWALLRRFTTVPRIVACAVDGTVAGGGVGLVAAADFAFATPRSSFALPEALWGLLPCCVAPFLIRRAGFRTAYTMSLGTQPLTAGEAHARGLVDAEPGDPEPRLRALAFRARRMSAVTVADVKGYFGRLAPVDAATGRLAVEEFARLMSSAPVGRRIADFAERRRFPWEVTDA